MVWRGFADAKTGRIQDENLIPFFKEEKYDPGVINTYNSLLKEVAAEYDIPYEPISSSTSSQPPANNENGLSWPAIIGIIVILYIVFRMIRSGGSSGGGPRSGGGGGYYRGGGGYFGGGGGFGRGGGFGGGGSAGGGGSSRGW